MPTYLHPGVYVEEVSGGARPIEAVGTSTAAFVGIAERGPIDKASFITNFTEFQQVYGGYVSDNYIGKSYLAYSVYQFFQNGGSSCYVVRVEDGANNAEIDLYTSEGLKTMTVEAVSPGSWGNDLRIAIGDPTTSEKGFNMYVLLKDEIVETYEDLSMVDNNIFFADRMTKRSLYIRTKSTSLPDNPTLVGKKDISTGVDMTSVKNIKLQIDGYGPYEIDCSEGVTPPDPVSATKIRDNINKAFENDIKVPVAFVVGNELQIVSPTAETGSKVEFTEPSEKDATYDIFGLQESSWVKTAEKKKLAQVLGQGLPVPGAGASIGIGLGSGSVSTVSVTAGAGPFDVVKEINDGLVTDIAYTDGTNLVLSADQDITVQNNVHTATLLPGFYSYVTYGAADKPAEIEGGATVGAVTGTLRLTVDKTVTFEVVFDGITGASDAAAAINSAYQKVSKNKKKIAKPDSGKVTLTSINTGTNGRIIVSSHMGTDVATNVLGSAYQNLNDHLVPAVNHQVARVEGNQNFDGATIGSVLAGRDMRLSADSEPVQFQITAVAGDDLETLFDDFKAKTTLNHKLLACVKTGSQTVHMIASSLTAKPEIRYSIPLASGPTSEHISDPSKETHAAYVDLFGTVNPFDQPAIGTPDYIYTFGPPDNNPKPTIIVSGEEYDFSESVSLTGGDEDRSDENRLANLTVGGVSGTTSGIRLLDKLMDVNILAIPGWSRMGDSTAKKFINDGTAYCDKVRPSQARPLRDLFYVTATPASVLGSTNARDFVRNQISTTSAGGYTAIYYPWIEVTDPIGTASPTISIPPAGTIAGLYASIDNRRGVWKAPAGTEAGLAGVISLADQVSDIKQDLLNPHGVNVIRRIPGAGIVSWGARTLATNPEWKYIPVRRTAILIEVSIYEGIQWAVFEPNDEPLWSSLRLSINAFMMTLFRAGAFQGATPEAAFFVKCDSETTTQNDIDLGRVNIHIGFAPLKPAEFVIVKISQKAGQTE